MVEQLKTLNDLEEEQLRVYESSGSPYERSAARVYTKRLKQEAIKWVKEDLGISNELPPINKSIWELLSKKWMKRFNITEEDLKDEQI